jgi:hypothetical protein
MPLASCAAVVQGAIQPEQGMVNRQQRSVERHLARAGVLLVVLLAGVAECVALLRARWQMTSGRA